jgi:hypothetical protein
MSKCYTYKRLTRGRVETGYSGDVSCVVTRKGENNVQFQMFPSGIHCVFFSEGQGNFQG